MMKQYELTEERIAVFWSRVEKHGACWVWQGKATRKGYGTFVVGLDAKGHVVNEYVHRIAFRLIKGEIPDGYHLHHSCPLHDECDHYRLCVNPDFLTPLTHSEHSRLENTNRHFLTCPNGHRRTAADMKRYWCLACQRENRQARLIFKRQSLIPQPIKANPNRRRPFDVRTWDIIKRWLAGEKQHLIAKHHGISRERVRQILAKAGYSERAAQELDIRTTLDGTGA